MACLGYEPHRKATEQDMRQEWFPRGEVETPAFMPAPAFALLVILAALSAIQRSAILSLPTSTPLNPVIYSSRERLP